MLGSRYLHLVVWGLIILHSCCLVISDYWEFRKSVVNFVFMIHTKLALVTFHSVGVTYIYILHKNNANFW